MITKLLIVTLVSLLFRGDVAARIRKPVLRSNEATSGNVTEAINVTIEIPKDSSVKYEEDKESGKFVVSRFLYTAMNYPFNYGYVPNTLAQDGDPIDVMVVSTHPVVPGCVLSSRVIGLLEMEDEAGIDHKIIAVPTQKIDPFYANIKDIADLNEATRSLIKHFFEQYKSTEPGKWVKVGKFLGKEAACNEIQASKLAYLVGTEIKNVSTEIKK